MAGTFRGVRHNSVAVTEPRTLTNIRNYETYAENPNPVEASEALKILQTRYPDKEFLISEKHWSLVVRHGENEPWLWLAYLDDYGNADQTDLFVHGANYPIRETDLVDELT